MAYLLIAGFLGLVLSIVLSVVLKRDARHDREVYWLWMPLHEPPCGQAYIWLAVLDSESNAVRVEFAGVWYEGKTLLIRRFEGEAVSVKFWSGFDEWPPADAIGWKPCQPPIFSDWKLKNERLASR